MGNSKNRWKLSLSFRPPIRRKELPPPPGFLCPITGALMSDPVILSNGLTFDRRCIEAAVTASSHPRHPILSSPAIPNLALKSAILAWCRLSGVPTPEQPDVSDAKEIGARFLEFVSRSNPVDTSSSESSFVTPPPEPLQIDGGPHKASGDIPSFSYAATEVNRRVDPFDSGSSSSISTPVGLSTKPACFSSSASEPSSQDSDDSSEIRKEDGDIARKLNSRDVSDQESGLNSLRLLTRTNAQARMDLCTREVLTCIRALLTSRYIGVQVNAAAAVVNLSLEPANKVKIVRSGLVPLLTDVLKGGHPEAQGHAAGAIFSLALDDDNKIAIGALGSIPPLVHLLRSSGDGRAKLDTAMALYHLTFMSSNRTRLIRAGALPMLLSWARVAEPSLASRVLLILCNVAAGSQGRAALLDTNAVLELVGLVAESWKEKREGKHAEAIREDCVAALCMLARDSSRFKSLAREAGAVQVLEEVVENGSDRARERAKKLLLVMKGCASSRLREVVILGDGSESESELNSEIMALARNRHRRFLSGPNSTDF